GQRLPTERELSEMFNVGRTTIREAIKALTYIGLLSRRREGTFIRGDSLEKLFTDPITQKLILKKISYKELFEARKLFEVKLAGLAAMRANEEDIGAIQLSIKEMAEAVKDKKLFVLSDIGFHQAIAEAAQNRVLYELFIAVRHILYKLQHDVIRGDGIKERAYHYHKKVFEAIKKQDSAKAEQLMFEHLLDVEKTLIDLRILDD
ncbi:MAG: FadR/GntR family transcriptional regulator, partial [Eubacteriales bacterium]